MIQNVAAIIIAGAAVIGLVPLGVRSVRDLIRNRGKKKNNEWLGTIGLSVLLSLMAPSVIEAVMRHVQAAGQALPDWVKAAVPEQAAQPPTGAPAASDPGNGQMPTPTLPAL